MRILFLTPLLASFHSGVGTYAYALARGLADRGHRVTAAVPEGEEVRLPGVRVLTVPRPRWDPTSLGWLPLGRSFARVLASEGSSHDVAHFADAREAWAASRAPLPVTAMVNDCYALDWLDPAYPRRLFSDRAVRGLWYRLLRASEGRTYRALSLLAANSGHVARGVAAGYGVRPDRIRVIYYGLAEEGPASPIPLPGSPAVLFAGGNFQRKGLPALIEAVSLLAPAFPGIALHVAGRDPHQRSMEELARRRGVGERVVFHGRQTNEHLRGMMAGATLFALPSLTEGFGFVYLEAMREGTPVVATSVGGAREVLRAGTEALFCDPGDVRGLAQAIARIASDPAFAGRLGMEGRKASARFSVEAQASATEDFFLAALEGCTFPGGSPPAS